MLVTSAALTRPQTMVSSDDPGPLPHAEPQATEPLLTGFKTGSGKSLLVTSAALTRAKSIFSDDPGPLPHAEPQATGPLLTGFKTGSGKSLLVASAALTRAKSIFSDDPGPLPHAEPQATEPLLTGFKTGSGKSLLVTSAALTRAKSIFSDDPGPLPHAEPQATEPLLTGFKTGSGKSLLVTSAALTRAKSIFSDDPGPLPHAEPQTTEPLLTGFKTGSGKSLLVTSAALTRAKSIFSIEAESVVERPNEGNSLLAEFQDKPFSPKKHTSDETDHLVRFKEVVEPQGLDDDEFDLKGLDVDTFVDFTQITCHHDVENQDPATDSSTKWQASPHGPDYSTPLKSLEDNDYFTTQVVRQILDFSFEEDNSPTADPEDDSIIDHLFEMASKQLPDGVTTAVVATRSYQPEPLTSGEPLIAPGQSVQQQGLPDSLPTDWTASEVGDFSLLGKCDVADILADESKRKAEMPSQTSEHLSAPIETCPAKLQPTSKFPGLQTASGKQVHVSAKALSIAQHTLSSTQPCLTASAETPSTFPGLQTASGPLSETLSTFPGLQTASGPLSGTPSTFPGLQTASGHLSETPSTFPGLQTASAETPSCTSTFPGLQTASGHLSETPSTFPGLQTASGHLSETPSTFPGLQTASGPLSETPSTFKLPVGLYQRHRDIPVLSQDFKLPVGGL